MAKGKRTSEETKRKVAERVASGEDKESIAQELGVSVFTVGDWARQYGRKPKRKISVPNAQNTRIARLKEENGKLRKTIRELELERDLWKSQVVNR